jgi:hypothetical protein
VSGVEQFTLGPALGLLVPLTVLRLWRAAALARLHRGEGDLGPRVRQERVALMGEHRCSPRLHLARLVGSSHRLAAVLADTGDTEQVLYSPRAEEQLVRLGVSREHVETALAQPTHATRRASGNLVWLERSFGNHTLRVHVRTPWPTPAEVYVEHVEWSRPTDSAT